MWFRNILRRAKESSAPSEADTNGTSAQLDPKALFQLNRLRLSGRRDLPGMAAGQRPSFQRRPTHDFREHRLYVPGDDIRYVDWKASARQEHTFIRQGENPRNITVSLLLDCTASMAWGEPSKKDKVIELAAALSYAALNHSDRLIISPLGEQAPKRIGPMNGKGQVPVVLKYLRNLEFSGKVQLTEAVRSFTRQTRGGLVLLLSDMLAMSDLDTALQLLPAPTWKVVVLHMLHPQEIEPEVRGNFQLEDVETGRSANYDLNVAALDGYRDHLNTWRNELDTCCVERHALYTFISSGWSLSREIIPHLRSLQILEPL